MSRTFLKITQLGIGGMKSNREFIGNFLLPQLSTYNTLFRLVESVDIARRSQKLWDMATWYIEYFGPVR